MEQQQQNGTPPVQQELKYPLGRKIFFLNPSFSMRQNFITPLKALEYEIYTITDYKRAKPYLRMHKDAIFYINPELQMNLPSWINFIHSIRADPAFSSIEIGIIADHLNPLAIKSLSENPDITGGVFHIDSQARGVLVNFKKKLDDLQAKGRRQYVRTICMNDSSANFLWILDNRMFKAQIVDISTASIAVLINQTNISSVQGKQEIFCTIQLGQKQIQTRAKPLVIKPNGAAYVGIFMLDDSTPQESIDIIREYVFETLELAMLKSVEGMPIDRTNYSVTTDDPRKNIFVQ